MLVYRTVIDSVQLLTAKISDMQRHLTGACGSRCKLRHLLPWVNTWMIPEINQVLDISGIFDILCIPFDFHREYTCICSIKLNGIHISKSFKCIVGIDLARQTLKWFAKISYGIRHSSCRQCFPRQCSVSITLEFSPLSSETQQKWLE